MNAMNTTQHFNFPMPNTNFMPAPGSQEALTRKRVTRQMQDLTKDWLLSQHDALELYSKRATEACLEHITTLAQLGKTHEVMRVFHYVSVCKNRSAK